MNSTLNRRGRANLRRIRRESFGISRAIRPLRGNALQSARFIADGVAHHARVSAFMSERPGGNARSRDRRTGLLTGRVSWRVLYRVSDASHAPGPRRGRTFHVIRERKPRPYAFKGQVCAYPRVIRRDNRKAIAEVREAFGRAKEAGFAAKMITAAQRANYFKEWFALCNHANPDIAARYMESGFDAYIESKKK